MTVNEEVLAIAEDWIGTPYRHQGTRKGIGCDCLGLIRGIWRELYGKEPEQVPAYAPDWAERAGEERLLSAAKRHFRAVGALSEARAGDLALFRFRPGMAAKHAAILTWSAVPDHGPDHGPDRGPDGGYVAADAPPPPDAFIHAYEQSAVIRSALVPGWKRRIAGIYRFPERNC